ncbi:Fanconi anemia group B protein [Hypomesus transpacificus]|uniref:Fanconi anemia group B protein n=1 Tax=Hypomesus transpacificus TaxID=137520 RepID=UPI001F07A803|nr:Fanconi anemia group B protein [Hypomesus transpacificus]
MTQEDRERQKLLSFLGEIVTFQCTIPTKNQMESELKFSRLSFHRNTSSFLKTQDGVAVIIRKSSPAIEIVMCSSALDVKKRVTRPCVLLTQCMKKAGFKYSLFSLSNSNAFESYMEFNLPYRMRDNVAILPGPTVLWSYGDDVFYTRAGEVRQMPIKLTLNIISAFPFNSGKTFILGSQTHSQYQSEDGGKSIGYLVEDEKLLDGASILPHAYSPITQCILVVSAEEVNDALKSVVVAATSRKQLVYFENGIPRDVCELPFEEPVDIKMVNLGRNGSLFAVSFNQGHACAIWKDTFQVASCWSGVRSLHVDDFLGCGTDQILLVYENLTENPLDNFLVTDLCGSTYSCCQESTKEKSSETGRENILLTVKALESRLQSGSTLLQDLQREVKVKEKVLLQSLQALADAVSGRDYVLTQPEQEGLVSLWDEEEETEGETLDEPMQVLPVTSPSPLVDKLWHRIIDDRLVVGVTLSPGGIIPVDSVSLSILTETGQSPTPAVLQTQSQASWFPVPSPPPPSSHPQPTAKRSRQEPGVSHESQSHRLAVTAVTSLTPLLTSSCVKCPVMLHYIQSQGSSAHANTTLTPVSVQCGEVPVDIRAERTLQLLDNCKLTADIAMEDLLSLLAVLDRWVFHIDSPDRSLGDVSGWVQRSMRCEKLDINPHYLLSSPAGPSAIMLFLWQQKTPFSGELSVHCSQFQLFQFLESLRAFLPASCSMLPLRHGGCEAASQPPALSLSLERELLSLKDGVSSLLRGEEEEGEAASRGRQLQVPDPGSAEGLHTCRDTWDRDKERSSRRLRPLVDGDRYRRLIHSLAQRQLEADVAALLDTQRTGI